MKESARTAIAWSILAVLIIGGALLGAGVGTLVGNPNFGAQIGSLAGFFIGIGAALWVASW